MFNTLTFPTKPPRAFFRLLYVKQRVMKYPAFTLVALIALCSFSAQAQSKKYPDPPTASSSAKYPMSFTPTEWKARLTPEQFYILRQQGTERAFTGKYDHFYQKGTYYSAA